MFGKNIMYIHIFRSDFLPNPPRYSLQDSFNVHPSAQFNVAENIATTSDMPYNAEKLLHRMKLDRR